MEVLQNMKIKSSIKNYNVNFSDNFIDSLKEVYNEGDIILVDKNVFTPLLSDMKHIILDISEKTKSFEYVPTLLDMILGDFNKTNKLIAIGGGITQDIVSFTASILFRGVDWIFFLLLY